MGSSGDILVGSVECPALNRRPAEPRPSGASNSATPVSFGGGRDARAPRQARCPRTQAGETPAPRQVHAGATPAASALGTRASGAHASEDAPPVRRRAVTLAPRPGSRRRNARAQRIPHAGRTPAHPGGMPAHPGRRNARALRRAGCPRTQAGEMPAHSGGRDARAPRRLVTPAPRQVHAGAMPAASALGTRASGAHASEDAPPVRRRAVTLAPRPGSRRRDARAPPGSRRRDARSVCPGYARLRRACQRGCASSAQAGSDARASSRLTQAQRPRPADTSRGQDARAPRQARCPRTQAGEMPALPGRRDARAPRRARCPRSQAGEMPALPGGRDARAPGGSCLNLQPRASRSSSRRSSQAHSSGVRRTSSATRLAANSSGVRHPTSA
jgi:hypothetical protein